jgi:hypothetical protein
MKLCVEAPRRCSISYRATCMCRKWLLLGCSGTSTSLGTSRSRRLQRTNGTVTYYHRHGVEIVSENSHKTDRCRSDLHISVTDLSLLHPHRVINHSTKDIRSMNDTTHSLVRQLQRRGSDTRQLFWRLHSLLKWRLTKSRHGDWSKCIYRKQLVVVT